MHKSLYLLPVAVAVQLALNTALAQETQDDTKTTAQNLERITVTGSRILESFDEVPASITIIDRDTIEANLHVTSELQSLLALAVPGMAPSTGSSSNFGQTLRGRNMLIMIDGVPQDTPLRNGALGIRTLDPASIERIEVLNGATSVWGNGAAGGVINYITKKPVDQGTMVSLTQALKTNLVKTQDTLGYRTVISVNGSEGNLGFVATLAQEKYGVQRDAEGDILGLQYGLSDSKQRDAFFKLNYDVADGQYLQLTYNYYDSDQDARYKDVPGNIDLGEKTYAVPLDENDVQLGAPQGPEGNYNVMAKYHHDALFANTSLNVDVYQQKIDNVFFWSPSLSNPDEGYAGGQSAILSEKQGFRSVLTSDFDIGGIYTTFIYGLDLLNDVTSQPLLDGRTWVPEMDMSSKAGFLQTKWELAQDWTLKAGVRREDISVQVDDYETLRLCRNATTCSTPMQVSGGDMDYAATTYNLGLRYRYTDAFSPYASYSEGYEVPDLGLLLRTATVNDLSLIENEASIIKNYEVGFSSDLDNLFFTVALYRSTSDLGTRNTYDPETGIYRPVRAPQKIWGFEATADYTLNNHWSVQAAYGYTEGKDTLNDVYLGARQISAPKLTSAVNYTPSQDINVTLNWLHVFSRDRFEPNEQGFYSGDQGPIDSYDVINLAASYQWGSWEFFGGIENLLNADYFPARSQALRYGTGYSVKGVGASLSLGATYQF